MSTESRPWYAIDALLLGSCRYPGRECLYGLRLCKLPSDKLNIMHLVVLQVASTNQSDCAYSTRYSSSYTGQGRVRSSTCVGKLECETEKR